MTRRCPLPPFRIPIRPLDGATDEQEIVFGNTELEIQRTRLPRGGMITRINDVTARNAAAWESARLQKRLQQAAKMEAIGQLAGGIAHDFSNILSSIMGFARFLEEDLPAGTEEQGFAKRILAVLRAGQAPGGPDSGLRARQDRAAGQRGSGRGDPSMRRSACADPAQGNRAGSKGG